jgi:hypothetical protein
VYDYGENSRTRYWVSREDGLLHQVKATLSNDGELVVQRNAHEPQRIRLPDTDGSG